MWQAITDLARRRNLLLEGTADGWWASSEPEFAYLIVGLDARVSDHLAEVEVN
jgi:hypothetical protein